VGRVVDQFEICPTDSLIDAGFTLGKRLPERNLVVNFQTSPR